MVRRIAYFVVLAASAVVTSAPALAQDGPTVPSRRLPTLSERLEQFRQDLLGDPEAASHRANPGVEDLTRDNRGPQRQTNGGGAGTPGADRKVAGARPARTGAAPKQATMTPTPATGSSAARGTPAPIPAAPQKLEPQAARRAQGPKTAKVEPADESDESDEKPTRRSVAKKSPTPVKKTEADSDDDGDESRVAKSMPSAVAKSAAKAQSNSDVLFTAESPVLSVETTGPRKVTLGKEAQFLVKIRNSGAAANNVVVTVNIPNSVEVLAANASAGAAQPPTQGERRETLDWKIERLDAKANETLTLKLVPRKSAPLDLGVNWTFKPEASQTLVEVQESKLVMAISGPDEVLFGQSKIYKLTVSNPGNGDTENVMVGLQPIGRSTETSAPHRIGTLKAGESKAIDIELTARQAGAITIRAQAFADGGLRSEAAELVLVRRAALKLTVEAPKVKYAGTVGSYRVKMVNTGNASADNVQLSAILPPEAKYIGSDGGGRIEAAQGKVSWPVGNLEPGGERSFELQCSLSAPGDNRMQFMTTGDNELSAGATSTTRVDAIADLKLEVRDPQGPIAVGENTVYEVHIRNRGTKAANGIELTVFFSEGLEATSVEGGPHEIASGQVTFKPIATLAAGNSMVYRVHALAQKSGNHVLRAEVVCQSLHTKLAAEEATHFYGDDAVEPVESTSESQEPGQELPQEDAPPELEPQAEQ